MLDGLINILYLNVFHSYHFQVCSFTWRCVWNAVFCLNICGNGKIFVTVDLNIVIIIFTVIPCVLISLMHPLVNKTLWCYNKYVSLIVSNTYTNVLHWYLLQVCGITWRGFWNAMFCSEYLWKLNIFVTVAPRRRYPYFDVVVGLVWSRDPESYAGNSDAIGMASQAR